jgi:hypothetical protein
LQDVIRDAKRQRYNRLVLHSSNSIGNIWDITKSVTGKLAKVDSIQELKVNGEVISNSQNIADFLNKLFLSIVDNIDNNPITNNKPLDYLRQALIIPFLVLNTMQ